MASIEGLFQTDLSLLPYPTVLGIHHGLTSGDTEIYSNIKK